MKTYSFYIYITTNPKKTALYIGITNDLPERLKQHYENRGNPDTYAGRYYCYNLIYYEEYKYVSDAIAREKQLKNWSRKKKEWLINTKNIEWEFLNKAFPYEQDSSTPRP